MAQLKIRIELNKGRTGAPLEKLGDVARQFDRFLRAVATDLKVEAKKGEWLAVKFKNGSVSWDAAFQGDVTEAHARAFNRALEFVADFDPDVEGANGMVSEATLLEYSKLGNCIDPDEVIGLGIFPSGGGRPKMRQISYRRTAQVRQAIESPVLSYGSVQGIVHALVKEAGAPFFHLREFSSDGLVRCFYPDTLYDQVVRVLNNRRTVVHATGHLTLDRAKRVVDQVRVERIDAADPLSAEDFDRFFGSAPQLTGDLSTSEYIEQIRSDER